jgi:septum site-determining protein MinC
MFYPVCLGNHIFLIMNTLIAIKGSKDGLRLVLDDQAHWPDILDALHDQLSRGIEFFQGAALTIDVGERPVSSADLHALLNLMHSHGLQPAALATNAPDARHASRNAGIATRPSRAAAVPATPAEPDDNTMIIRRTLRSGQEVRHWGLIIVLGDVNPGAEVIAGGAVVVWGRLRGRVHAGALGDREAFVCALEFSPALLRIADVLTRPPEDSGRGPELARIDNQHIVVELWESTSRG